jgi:hypothetical protein
MKGISSWVAIGQGFIYLGTGVWPLICAGSFQKVTGPKIDFWLVKTVGLLISVIGAVLGLAGARRRVTTEIALLGIGSAASLAAVDVVYVSKKRISPVYLFDAVMEAGLISFWALAAMGQKPGKKYSSLFLE